MKTKQPSLGARDQEALRRVIARDGLKGAAGRLGVCEMTLGRAAAGAGLNSTTRTAITLALAALSASHR